MIADFFSFFGKLIDAIMQKLYPMPSSDNVVTIKLKTPVSEGCDVCSACGQILVKPSE